MIFGCYTCSIKSRYSRLEKWSPFTKDVNNSRFSPFFWPFSLCGISQKWPNLCQQWTDFKKSNSFFWKSIIKSQCNLLLKPEKSNLTCSTYQLYPYIRSKRLEVRQQQRQTHNKILSMLSQEQENSLFNLCLKHNNLTQYRYYSTKICYEYIITWSKECCVRQVWTERYFCRIQMVYSKQHNVDGKLISEGE